MAQGLNEDPTIRKKRGRPPKVAVRPPREGPDDFRMWSARIDRARQSREDWMGEFEVETLERFAIGKHYADGAGRYVYNRFGATIRTLLPSLVIEDPRFLVRRKVRTRAQADDLKPRMAEGLLDATAKQDHHLADGARLGLQQAMNAMGVMKTVFDPKMVPNPRAGEFIPERGPGGLPILDAQGMPVVAMDPITGESMVEPDKILDDEAYRWEWVDFRNMLLPNQGCDQRKWTWIAEEITVPLSDAKRDERFPEGLRAILQSNATSGPAQAAARGRLEQDDVEDEALFMYTEIYDFSAREIKILAEIPGHNDFAFVDDLPPGVEKHPYSLLRFQKITGPVPSPWPYPLTRDWLPVQEDYNFVRRFETQGAARGGRKGLYYADTFENEEEADKFMNAGDDMLMAMGQNKESPPFFPPHPPLPADLWRNNDALNQDWNTVTHQSGPRGQRTDAGSATEAMIAERSSDVNDADLANAVRTWFADMGTKMFQLMQQTMTLERQVAIRELQDGDLTAYLTQVSGQDFSQVDLGPAIREMFIQRLGHLKTMPVTREQLEFDAEIEIIPGSTKPRNLDTEHAQLVAVANLIGPLVFTIPEFNEALLAKFEQLPAEVSAKVAAVALQKVQVDAMQAGRLQGGGSPDPQGGGGSVQSNIQRQAPQPARR